jgi:hypothetical protein
MSLRLHPGAQPSSGARIMVDRRRGERRGGGRRNRIRSDTKNATAVAKRVARPREEGVARRGGEEFNGEEDDIRSHVIRSHVGTRQEAEM